MSRGVGALEAVQELLPAWAALLAAALTQLGDMWFLALFFVVLYWFDAPRREAIATVAGAWLAGAGAFRGLKAFFGLPRPNEPLADPSAYPPIVRPVYEATAMAGGYGFPSGHAVNATIVYVGLAAVLAVGTRRQRAAGAAAIVGIVCLTRIALGVHYLVDVVAGVAVGLCVLLAVGALAARRPDAPATSAFGLAVVCGVFFVVMSGAVTDSILVLIASIGALIGLQTFDLGRDDPGR